MLLIDTIINNKKLIFISFLLFDLEYSAYSQTTENCPNKININDTLIKVRTDTIINLCAENNADLYSWSNGDTTKCVAFHLVADSTYSIILNTYNILEPNLVVNGDFESGNTGFQTDYTYNTRPFGQTNGFNYGNYCITNNINYINHYFMSCPSSNHYAIFDADTIPNRDVYKTTIENLEPNTYYLLTYQIRALNSPQIEHEKPVIETFINDSSFGTIVVEDNNCTWQTINYIWHSDDTTSCRIRLIDTNITAGGNDFGLDNISLKKLCVADDTVNIRIQYPIAENDTIKVSICENELPFLFRNTEYTSAGDYSIEEGDTTFVLQLSVNPIYSDTINADICFGEIYLDDNFNESTTGTYTKNFTSINNCDSIIVLNLNVHDIYVLNIEDTIYKGEVFNRYGLILSDSGEYTVKYRLSAEDFCPTTINLILHVIERPEIEVYFPNAFTPSLSTNNVFRYYVDENDIYFIRFEIFDRWGTKVFLSEKLGEYWDGTYKGKPCDMSTFAYKFLYSPKYDKNTVKELSGEFLLLR